MSYPPGPRPSTTPPFKTSGVCLRQALLASNADTNAQTSNADYPVHLAAQHGHWHVVRLLVPHPGGETDVPVSDASALNKKAKSVLMASGVASGEALSHRARVLPPLCAWDVQNSDGMTPSALAMAAGHRYISAFLGQMHRMCLEYRLQCYRTWCILLDLSVWCPEWRGCPQSVLRSCLGIRALCLRSSAVGEILKSLKKNANN